MGYERIPKPQMGVVSPTKLRMKLLLGSHGGGETDDDGSGRSSRRLDEAGDDDHPRNSLLAQELDEEYPKDRSDSSRSRSDASRGDRAGSGCDSGLEFRREEVRRPFFQPVAPSKWNDAEKWIAGRHVVHSNPMFSNTPACAAPESAASKVSVSAVTELSSKSSSPSSVSWPAGSGHPPQKKRRAAPSMRDVGTEMTPVASQEQSRSGTPATPSLSPLRSLPDSPRVRAPSSEREQELLRLRTRREIAALGLQLGKMNIASWASKEEGLLAQAASAAGVPGSVDDELRTKVFEARAAAWEESRKCKLASRYQKREMKIQEWESCRKLKFEAKMKQAEVKAEQMRARAKQDMAKRLSVLSHKVEGKQARVEARRSRQAARLARQVERIRKTGRAPSRFRRCCTWFL